MMKLLTINTHSLIESDYMKKLRQFTQVICRELPDIIAMQEVNQSADAPEVPQKLLTNYCPCEENHIPVRMDNHAFNVARLLQEAGITCFWTWLPAKLGYSVYDEGLALFSLKHRITDIDSLYTSSSRDYQNWKTRRVLGIRTDMGSDWFYTVHMGWWADEEEPFRAQWERLQSHLNEKNNSRIWLLGDFNSPAEVRGESYDYISASGWQDTWLLAAEKDSGITVNNVIDGWKDQISSQARQNGMRIDHIWCSQTTPIQKSQVIFNQKNHPVISDHFGVIIVTS